MHSSTCKNFFVPGEGLESTKELHKIFAAPNFYGSRFVSEFGSIQHSRTEYLRFFQEASEHLNGDESYAKKLAYLIQKALHNGVIEGHNLENFTQLSALSPYLFERPNEKKWKYANQMVEQLPGLNEHRKRKLAWSFFLSEMTRIKIVRIHKKVEAAFEQASLLGVSDSIASYTESLLATYDSIVQPHHREVFLQNWHYYYTPLLKNPRSQGELESALIFHGQRIQDRFFLMASPLRDLFGNSPKHFWKNIVVANQRVRQQVFREHKNYALEYFQKHYPQQPSSIHLKEAIFYAKKGVNSLEQIQNICASKKRKGRFSRYRLNKTQFVQKDTLDPLTSKQVELTRAALSGAVSVAAMLLQGHQSTEGLTRGFYEAMASYGKMKVFNGGKWSGPLKILTPKTTGHWEQYFKSLGINGGVKSLYTVHHSLQDWFDPQDFGSWQKFQLKVSSPPGFMRHTDLLAAEISSDVGKELLNQFFISPYFSAILCVTPGKKAVGIAAALTFYATVKFTYDYLVYNWIRDSIMQQ